MNILYLIPARGGSKGIPKKNIKKLGGKPLIYYAIDAVKTIDPNADICVSSDSEDIIEVVEQYPLAVPFKRPAKLATDKAGSFGVLKHAISFFEKKGKIYDTLVLLQPTSPFRKSKHIKSALELFSLDLDMVVSVCAAEGNPYYSLFEENDNGFLSLSKTSNFTRRQDIPKVYEYNGAVYVINVASLKKYDSLAAFPKIKKYEMDRLSSIDLDVPLDWEYAEFLLERGHIK